MKLFIYLSIYLFIIPFQEKEVVYLFFDSNSKETCKVLKDGGGYLDQKKFQKIKQKNGRIDFYFCEEVLESYKASKKDTCTITYLNNIKFSKLENLKKTVNKINPLYPWKVFKKVYVVEKINEKQIVKHEVKWQYYIE